MSCGARVVCRCSFVRICSNKSERIGGVQPKKKKSFLGFLQDTVRLKFKHTVRGMDDDE